MKTTLKPNTTIKQFVSNGRIYSLKHVQTVRPDQTPEGNEVESQFVLIGDNGSDVRVTYWPSLGARIAPCMEDFPCATRAVAYINAIFS